MNGVIVPLLDLIALSGEGNVFQEFKVPSDGADSGKLGQLFFFLNDESPTGGPGS